MKLRKKHKEQTELHVGPLNDILFILLFFFLLVSTLAAVNAMKMNLPKGKSDTRVAQKNIVSVDSTNRMYFNTLAIESDSLASVLEAAFLKDTSVKQVVFNGDVQTNYGEFVRVLALCNKLGLKMAVNVKDTR